MLANRIFSIKSDAYAFGGKGCIIRFLVQVTLWEIFNNGMQPWPDKSNEDAARAILEGNESMLQMRCPSEIYSICKECWMFQAKDRPSFVNLLAILELTSGNLSSNIARDVGYTSQMNFGTYAMLSSSDLQT